MLREFYLDMKPMNMYGHIVKDYSKLRVKLQVLYGGGNITLL